MTSLLAFHIPFFDEWMVIAFIGLLLFGKRLPEVGRSIGKGIVEFKKGLAGIEDDIETATTAKPATNALPAQHKFDPQTGQPLQPQINSAVPEGAKFDPYTGKPVTSSQTSSV